MPNWAAKDRPFYVGLSFDCPCPKCNKDACPTCGHKDHSQRIQLKFWPAIDSTKVAQQFETDFRREHHEHMFGGGPVFDREGDDFETLTLAQHACMEGHWNGRIVNGELINGASNGS